MANESQKVSESIKQEILVPSLDLAIDYGEIALDSIIEDKLISEIPIIKTVSAVYKVGAAIKDRLFLKNLMIFFKEFHSGKIEEKKLKLFRKKIAEDSKYRNKVCETIVVFNERFTESIKSKILANLLLAHVNGDISIDYFNDLVIIVDAIHPKGMKYLHFLSQHEHWRSEKKDLTLFPLIMAAGLGYLTGLIFNVNDLGKDLHKFGIKTLYE